jgi:hypothetical protein
MWCKRDLSLLVQKILKHHGITRLFFTFRLRGMFNLMGQNFAVWSLEIKNDLKTVDNVNRCRNGNLIQKQPQLSASIFKFEGWKIKV